MKKTIFLLMAVLFISFSFSFFYIARAEENKNIYISDNKVYYACPGGAMQAPDDLNIDIESVEIINDRFFKDKNNVYSASEDSHSHFCFIQKIDDMDSETFNFINNYYQRDKYHVFFSSYYWGWGSPSIIKNADAESFRIITKEYAIDKNSAYYANTTNLVENEDVDTNSFEVIDCKFSKDKNNVYLYLQSFDAAADPDTFKIINDEFSKDKNNVYYGNKSIEKADPDTFKIINDEFSKDKNNVYYGNKYIKKANPDTFNFISHWYYKNGKDKNNVYFMDGSGILSNDAENFMPIDVYYAKDSNNVFYNEEIMDKADPNTIKKCIGLFFFVKDDTNVFYKGQILEGVDAKTFEFVFKQFYKDKNYVYSFDAYYKEMTPIDGIDPISFEKLSNIYAKDKNNVYYIDADNIQLLSGANLEKFIPLNVYGKDNNNVFYKGNVMDCRNQLAKTEDICPDLESFEYIGSYGIIDFSKDKKYYYQGGKILTNMYYLDKAKEAELIYKKTQEIIKQNINKITQNADYTAIFDNIYYKY